MTTITTFLSVGSPYSVTTSIFVAPLLKTLNSSASSSCDFLVITVYFSTGSIPFIKILTQKEVTYDISSE